MAGGSGRTVLSFEEITNMEEMMNLMQCLGLRFADCNSISKMKHRVREHARTCAERTRLQSHQVFSLISDAVKEDLYKRGKMERFFSDTESSLAEFDKKSLDLLKKNMGEDVKESLAARRACLRRNYVVLVAGETSAGKSSFLNMILGDQFLPSSVLCTTSKICELRYGEKRQVCVHLAEDGPSRKGKIKTYDLRDDQPYMDQISRFVTQGSELLSKRVQIFLPHPLLRGGITIVDSPGIGESEELDDVVMDYLPEAFAFVYIINSSNAGGIQKDRIEKLLHQVRKAKREFNPACALFVCNKWDQVPHEEWEQVISHVCAKLQACWPGLDVAKQVTYLSTKNAVVAQKYGIVTYELANLLDGIGRMIATSMECSLKVYWGWLDNLLCRLIHRTQAFVKTCSRDEVENRTRIQSVLKRLEELEGHQKDVIRDLQAHLDSKTKSAVEALIRHLRSEDVKAKFCQWDDDDIPQEESFEKLDSALETLCENRAKELLEEWEESQEAFASARQSIVKHFSTKYKRFENELLNLEQSVVTSHHEHDGETKTQDNAANKNFLPNVALTTRNKIIIGATFPIWLPFSLVAVIIGAPVVGFAAMAHKAEQFIKQKIDPRSLLERKSRRYIERLATEDAIGPFVEAQLEDARECLKQIQERIPHLIEADRALCEQLLNDDRSRKRAVQFYCPLHDVCREIRGKLAMFALQEILPLDDEMDGLEWKKNQNNLLGRGSYARVYRGRLKQKSDRAPEDVAVKVYKNPLMPRNACDFLAEERNLRKLSHPNIVKLYGMVLHQRSDTSEAYPTLVLELCDQTLSSRILHHPENVPANNPQVKRLIFHWGVQISDGLRYIHQEGLVHRDLKLENILVKNNRIKIADVGLAKSIERITGTLCGTLHYMAPEVASERMYGKEADIYSLALVLWEMWYGQRVFRELGCLAQQKLFETIRGGYRPRHLEGKIPPPEIWQRVLVRCWDGNPKSRYTAERCCEFFMSLLKMETTGHHKRL